MKIYFIGQKGIPAKFGGIERHVEQLASSLAKTCNEVFVYTRPNYTNPNLKNYKNINLISIPSITTKHLDAITHTFRCCLDVIKRDADIIHFHSIGPSSLIWIVKLFKPNTTIISTFHTKCYLHKKWGILARTYLKLGEMSAFWFADKIITVSHSLTDYSRKKYKKNNIVYIPNGASLPKLYGAKNIKRWGLEKNNYILTVSRLIGHKGLEYLIDAYKNIETDKKLVIAGDGVHTDSYVKRLKKSASKNAHIIFTGNQTGKTLAELFSNAYIFVQPSESEGLSIALLEAMSYKNGCLVSDIPENIELINVSAFLFHSRHSASLRDKLSYLLNRPDLIASKGKFNRAKIKTYYNWTDITKETINLYENTIAEKRSSIIASHKIKPHAIAGSKYVKE